MADDVLPSFRDPPVTEVALGVVFKPIEGLGVLRIGQLWADKFADHFPRDEEQPPYEPPAERFDIGVPNLALSIELGSFPRPRIWFLNEAGDELVQIQRNYFACNWRKVTRDTDYERWATRRAAFTRWFSAFEDFLAEHSLGSVVPTQCEVAYVNHIEPGQFWTTHADVSSLLRLVGTPEYEQEHFPGKLEQVQFGAQFRLENEGEPYGRLHLIVQPAFRLADNVPIYTMQLTARGQPLGDGAEGMFRFFEEGRRAIVTAFAASTTSAMHEAWGRYV